MQHSFGANKLNPFFARDEVALGQKDRRTKVSDQQLLTFPFNAIGWIRSKQKYAESDDFSDYAKGTGFLIAPSLVLTSSHNFVIRDDTNGEVIEYEPISFCTLQPGANGLVAQVSKIKAAKLNFQFVGLLNKIVMMEKMFFSEGDQVFRQKYMQQALELSEKAMSHDFALLKLEEPIVRPQYFELCPSLAQPCELAVTGYVHHYGNQFTLFTHSNKINSESISNGGIYYDIDTKGGQSGCPVYLLKDNCKVVAIHKSYNPQRRLNSAAMITESVIDVLKLWAVQMEAPFGVKLNQNPNEKNPTQQINELREKGDQLRDKAHFEEALSYYQGALDIAEKVKSRESVEYANILGSIGVVYELTEQNEMSLRYFTSELKIYESILEKQSLQKANAFTNIIIVERRLDKEEFDGSLTDIIRIRNRKQNKQKAKQNYQSAVEIYNRIGTESIKCPYTLLSIGLMYYIEDESIKALEYYGRALVIHEKIGKESVGWADTLNNIGLVCCNTDKAKQTLEYYLRAVAIHENIGKESIVWANTLNNIGLLYCKQEKFSQALEYFLRAEAIHGKIGKESIGWAITLNKIGLAYSILDKVKQAFEYYLREDAIYEKIGTVSIDRADRINKIACVYKNQGKFQQALEYYFRAMVIYKRIGKESFSWINTLNDIGTVYRNQDKPQQALEYQLEADEIGQRLDRRSICWADSRKNVGILQRKQGLHEKRRQFIFSAQKMKGRLK